MSRLDGRPVPLHSYQCPFCQCELAFVKRVQIGVVYGHFWYDHFRGDHVPEICPNNAALFLMRRPGNSLERLEPIV